MILRNTVNAALQRACVYRDEADLELRSEFKAAAKKWLLGFGDKYRRSTVSQALWCAEIESLSEMLTQEFGPYLRDGRVRFGVCQKMVSLYLKYLWLITNDDDKKPLYAVIDRGIMRVAGIPKAPNWTLLDDRRDYIQIVEAIDSYARKGGHVDGAYWEADEWVIDDDE